MDRSVPSAPTPRGALGPNLPHAAPQTISPRHPPHLTPHHVEEHTGFSTSVQVTLTKQEVLRDREKQEKEESSTDSKSEDTGVLGLSQFGVFPHLKSCDISFS